MLCTLCYVMYAVCSAARFHRMPGRLLVGHWTGGVVGCVDGSAGGIVLRFL